MEKNKNCCTIEDILNNIYGNKNQTSCVEVVNISDDEIQVYNNHNGKSGIFLHEDEVNSLKDYYDTVIENQRQFYNEIINELKINTSKYDARKDKLNEMFDDLTNEVYNYKESLITRLFQTLEYCGSNFDVEQFNSFLDSIGILSYSLEDKILTLDGYGDNEVITVLELTNSEIEDLISMINSHFTLLTK